MKKLMFACALGATTLLAACGDSAEDTAMESDSMNALPADETTTPDNSATLNGAGDTTGAAGAGAMTGAMDGGAAGADGLPTGDAARGGAEDAMGGAEAGGAAGDGGPPPAGM